VEQLPATDLLSIDSFFFLDSNCLQVATLKANSEHEQKLKVTEQHSFRKYARSLPAIRYV
jgi:hypothetical protein